MGKKNKIHKQDFDRTLLTETLPYEVPLSFATDGLYSKIKDYSSLDNIGKLLIEKIVLDARSETIPYRYKITKTHGTFRRLVLLHPNSQWMIKEFYQKYAGLMLFYTSISPATIRSPDRIASTFYNKNSWENIYQYKDTSVALNEFEQQARHLPSFFAYRGYDRLWKFFNADEYIELERRFASLITMDVARCFDSIYTHCLSWATKNKQFTKNNIKAATFGNEFDFSLRHGNHSETNGIPIGPEVSRIFAEIILQRVDLDAINRLKINGYLFDIHYKIRRYVDDIYIYANTEATGAMVQTIYADCLLKYNLHPNAQKTQATTRPFVTAKSSLVSQAIAATDNLIRKIFNTQESKLSPKLIHDANSIYKSYVAQIKSICHGNHMDYYDISSLLIAIFNERIKRLCEPEDSELSDTFYFTATKLVLDICFFLYSVAPSVNASYKLSTSIILSVRFFRMHIAGNSDQLNIHIFSCVVKLLEESRPAGSVAIEEFVELEAINVVLAAAELGNDLLMPPHLIERVFLAEATPTYFSMVSCLFYIQDHPQFSELKDKIVKEIGGRLANASAIQTDSETAHLFLDAISCPFISNEKRNWWLRSALKNFGDETTKAEAQKFLDSQISGWSSCWHQVDLLNVLEKKELKSAY